MDRQKGNINLRLKDWMRLSVSNYVWLIVDTLWLCNGSQGYKCHTSTFLVLNYIFILFEKTFVNTLFPS